MEEEVDRRRDGGGSERGQGERWRRIGEEEDRRTCGRGQIRERERERKGGHVQGRGGNNMLNSVIHSEMHATYLQLRLVGLVHLLPQ